MGLKKEPSVASKRVNQIMRVLIIALVGNLSAALIKIVFGLLANSVALLADAIHSLFDSLSSIIGIYGIKKSVEPPDHEHPYGHTKFEYIATLGIVVMLFVACFNILREALDRVVANIVPTITIYTFASIFVSIVISLSICIYERKIGKATSSMILLADSSHTLTDVLALLVVIAGFIGTRIGFSYADPFAAIIVCTLIAYVGFSMFKEASNVLVDKGITLDTLGKVKATVDGLSEKVGCQVECHDVRGKVVNDRIYIDMHITCKSDLSVEESHKIADTIEKKLKQRIIEIEEVIIHVEPSEE